jgi:hypothetical protein
MTAGYWPRPWTCEDGGPRRGGSADGQPGLGLKPGERLELTAARDAFATDALVRREPGELYALRHPIPIRGVQSTPVEGWVERLDPITLDTVASTPRLPGGAYWPGGIAAHANGDLHMVFGRWAHRLSPALEVLASHRLPVPRPHNSFVVLDGGELVTKDCDAPAGREPSTVSALDPQTLLPVAPPLRLEQPVVARLASDGEGVVAIGATVAYLLRLDRDAGRLSVDERWQPRYGPAPERSYGWDPVITAEHVLWMDNGRTTPTGRCSAAARRRARSASGGRAATMARPCARSRSAGSPSEPSRTRRAGIPRGGSWSPTTPATRSCAPGGSRATSSPTSGGATASPTRATRSSSPTPASWWSRTGAIGSRGGGPRCDR